jgi:hypothetical protein
MSQYLSNAHRKVGGVVLMTILLVAGCGGVVYALGAAPGRAMPPARPAANRPAVAVVPSKGGPWLSIRAESSHGAVLAGRALAFGMHIGRPALPVGWRGGGRWHFVARIWLGVTTRLPAGVSASFTPSGTRGSAATLTFETTLAARRGVYRVRVNAHGRFHRHGRYRGAHAYTFVTLTVTSFPSQRFTIAGATTSLLVPGGAAGIDLRLTNPGRVALRVGALVVSIRGVQAPLADATHPCTVSDFAVAQFSGGYGFTVPRSSTRSLAQLGFVPALWPSVLMRDPPVNQDGCEHATVALSFAGVSAGGA